MKEKHNLNQLTSVFASLLNAHDLEIKENNKGILKKLEELKGEALNEREYVTKLNVFFEEVEEAMGSTIVATNRWIAGKIATGEFESFLERYFTKLEGFSCSCDKASFACAMVMEAQKRNENMSLYENYTNIPSMEQYGDKQCYWSPKTIADTDTAIKLYSEYYKLNFDEFLRILKENEEKR